MSSALVVLSGGLDSATALALALKREDRVEAVTFEYGQRHAREINAAEKIASAYQISHQTIFVPVFSGTSVLKTDAEMPQMTYEELQAAEGPSPTYVPYRNGTFLSIAAGLALERDLETIYAGMHGEDAHNWAYPDCTPEFIGAMQNAIYIGTYMKVRLIAPFSYKTKAEIIALGIQLGVPYELTYSCYEGREVSCGRCPTCIARLEAFRANGARDPIEYEFDKYGGQKEAQVSRASLELNRMLGKEYDESNPSDG